MSPDRPRLIPDCDEAENDCLLNAIADHLEAEMDRSGPPRPRARIAELQATIDRRVAEDQRRILERHAAAAREWPGGEPTSEEPPGFAQFMLGAFVGSILGLLAGIGMSLLVQGVL